MICLIFYQLLEGFPSYNYTIKKAGHESRLLNLLKIILETVVLAHSQLGFYLLDRFDDD